MNKIFKMFKISALSLILVVLMLLAACGKADMSYGVSDVESESKSFVKTENNPIMSSDKVMPKYFDIMLFDEENYSNVYLGKNFKINATFLGEKLVVPASIKKMEEMGWNLADENTYKNDSRVLAYESVEVIFKNKDGVLLKALMYNSSGSSVLLKECKVVKFFLDNNFYADPKNVKSFNISGITNSMAITDIIEVLGTPSHFYEVSKECYYLDYFISGDDRRNGITVYINPVADSVISVEFSSYK